ncbi:MAG: HEPN domain-containing protein [Draconibacterium sp.]
MTLSNEEKNHLIDYRLKQAIESLEIAEVLIKLPNYPTALNRLYYSVFYSLLAVGLKYEFTTSKHSQLIGWFNKNFISTGKLKSKYGKIVRKAYEYRLMADYDAFVEFEKENVEKLFVQSKDFLNSIIKLLQ